MPTNQQNGSVWIQLECDCCWVCTCVLVYLAADCKGVVEEPVHSARQEDVVPCWVDWQVQALEAGALEWRRQWTWRRHRQGHRLVTTAYLLSRPCHSSFSLLSVCLLWFLFHIQISNLSATNIFTTSGSKLGTHRHKNKLCQIYPTIPFYSTLHTSYQRKDQIVYNRLRIGHTRLTHLPYWTHWSSKMYKL